MEYKKFITIKFNSNSKISGTNANANYYIDWSAILKDSRPYTLTWTYTAQQNVFTAATKVASVYINIFANNYIANTYGAGITQHIGNLKNDNNTLNADINSNMAVFLNSRPQDNNVNVQILTNDSPAIAWTDNAGVPVGPNNYILTLTFSEL